MREQFEEFIKSKYPTRSPKVLFQQFDDVDGSKFYMVKEVQDQAEAWQARQAEVDQLTKALNTKEQLNKKMHLDLVQAHEDIDVFAEGMEREGQFKSQFAKQLTELKLEYNDLLTFNGNLDRERRAAIKSAEKYKSKVLGISNLLRDCRDQDMTLKAIKVVVERVGEF